MKIKKSQLEQIIKEEIEAALSLHQESLEEITPEMIAQFAWEDGIRIIDFGDPDKEPKLGYKDKKRIAKMIADEADIEIDMWGDAVDRNITLDFINFKDKVFTALWHMHNEEIMHPDPNDLDNYADEYERMHGDPMDEDKDWIQKAVDPDHEGYCTPMTKKTCTPKRKALAKRFKKAAKKKDREGGTGWQGKV